jgi:hypothetical protein
MIYGVGIVLLPFADSSNGLRYTSTSNTENATSNKVRMLKFVTSSAHVARRYESLKPFKTSATKN